MRVLGETYFPVTAKGYTRLKSSSWCSTSMTAGRQHHSPAFQITGMYRRCEGGWECSKITRNYCSRTSKTAEHRRSLGCRKYYNGNNESTPLHICPNLWNPQYPERKTKNHSDGNVGNVGGYEWLRQRLYRTSLYLPLGFSMNLKEFQQTKPLT